MDEILDIFDESMNWVGQAPRKEVHRLGHWHQTFHCWVLHKTPTGNFLVLQRRHPSKDTNPNKLDVSCAGHLDAGEHPRDGIRELKEELGIIVNFDALYPVGVYKESFTFGEIIDNEFSHVFVLGCHGEDISHYHPALGEVSGLYLMRCDVMEQLCTGKAERVIVSGFEVDDQGEKQDQTIETTLTDLVERPIAYYEMLFSYLQSV